MPNAAASVSVEEDISLLISPFDAVAEAVVVAMVEAVGVDATTGDSAFDTEGVAIDSTDTIGATVAVDGDTVASFDC